MSLIRQRISSHDRSREAGINRITLIVLGDVLLLTVIWVFFAGGFHPSEQAITATTVPQPTMAVDGPTTDLPSRVFSDVHP